MAKITTVLAREVLDSRGTPTVAAEVHTEVGHGWAAVPSGASTGEHEAHELRDGDNTRFRGKGVQKAVKNIAVDVRAVLTGKDTANQSKVDRLLLELDGTPDKSRLGANAILAVSLACARAEAQAQGLPLYLYLQQLYPKTEPVLPIPQLNLVNGGAHAQNNLQIQEFHLLPIGAATFAEALRLGVEVFWALGELLIKEGYGTGLGDEGGYAPAKLDSTELVFTLLVRAIEEAGYTPGVDAFLGIDAAANEFYDSEKQLYRLEEIEMTSKDLAYKYKEWREQFPLISVEDPFEDDAWVDWNDFTSRNGNSFQVVGDDLYATNPTRIQRGIMEQSTNAVLVKPNQIGTLSETLKAILLAQEAGQRVIVSHRSGETEDPFIADLAVAVGAGQIKTGAPVRGERTAKYNRLLEIETEVGGKLAKVLQPFLVQNQPQST